MVEDILRVDVAPIVERGDTGKIVVDRSLSLCSFSFDHCVVCPSSILRILITPLVSSNSSCPQNNSKLSTM